MQSTLRYAGLDVHKDSTVIGVAEAGGGEAKVWGRVGSDPAAVEDVLQKLGGPHHVKVCYEAGPTGYGLARRLRAAGYSCDVVAPSLVPTDTRRIKTDNRDAIRLAHFLRSGNLTAIAIPDAATEAIDDLNGRTAAEFVETTRYGQPSPTLGTGAFLASTCACRPRKAPTEASAAVSNPRITD